MGKVKEIVVNRKTFRFPFEKLFRPLSEVERTGLTESIKTQGGIHCDVQIYESKKYGINCVIDGMNRVEIAGELGVTVPFIDHGRLSDEKALELAKSLNLDRRQLTLEEQQELRSERIQRVVESREEGKSLPLIAEEEGVSVGQVQRDLEKASGLSGDKPEVPEIVVGKDGKEQKSTKTEGSKKPGRKPKESREIVITEEDEQKELAKRKRPETPKDSLGNDIPSELRDTFLDPELAEAIAELKAIQRALDVRYQKVLKSLSHKPLKFCHFGKVQDKLADVVHPKTGFLQLVIEHLEAGEPYAVCPCKGEKSNCRDCRTSGYLPQWRYEELQAAKGK